MLLSPTCSRSSWVGRRREEASQLDGHPVGNRVEATFEPCPESVRAARQFVAATLEAWSLDDLSEVAMLCTSEVATNAVRHARTAFRLAVEARTAEVLFEVEDLGGGEPTVALPDTEAEDGRGMWLVTATAGRWGSETLQSGGKIVWFSLPRIAWSG